MNILSGVFYETNLKKLFIIEFKKKNLYYFILKPEVVL